MKIKDPFNIYRLLFLTCIMPGTDCKKAAIASYNAMPYPYAIFSSKPQCATAWLIALTPNKFGKKTFVPQEPIRNWLFILNEYDPKILLDLVL